MFRKIWLIAVLALSLTCLNESAKANERWISLNGSASIEQPSAEILTSNNSETVIRFTIPGFLLDEVSEDGVAYQVLSFPGYATTQNIGKAELPVIREFVSIPARAGVKAHIVGFEEIALEGYNVHPFQRILNIGEKRARFDVDKAFYGRSEFYPEPVTVSDPGIWRDVRIVNLCVAPVRYNPASGELRVYTSVTVRLEYAGENITNAKTLETFGVTPAESAAYESSVLNYEASDVVSLSSASASKSYDLLIIAESRFTDDLDEFVAWKTQKGYKTKVVRSSKAGATAEEIKAFVKREYESYGISYLLLVGTEEATKDAIPFYIYDGPFQTASDYYYALLDGSDLYPEIGVGRFPALDETELANMISKSLVYESNPPEDEWLEKVQLVAHQEGAPLSFQLDQEEIRLGDFTESGTYYRTLQPDFDLAYGALSTSGGTNATNQDIIDCINTGVRVVDYYGHGTGSEWAYWSYLDGSFGFTELDQLTNAVKAPVVVTQACITAAPGQYGGCLGERFVRGASGAVAYYGATAPTLTLPAHNKGVMAALFDSGIPTISGATNVAQMRSLRIYPTIWIDYAVQYLWYGDPTLSVLYEVEDTAPPPLTYPGLGESVEPGTVVLDWEDSERVDDYEQWVISYVVQLDDNPDFSSPVVNSGSLYTEFETPQLTEGVYYWRVRDFLIIEGDYGPWSETRHFFVGIPTVATTLIAPADGANPTIVERSDVPDLYQLYFSWQNPLSPPEYLLQIDDDPDFSSPEVVYATSATGYRVDLGGTEEETTYYWRVCGKSDAAWPWSEVRTFSYLEQEYVVPDPDPIIPASNGGSVAYPNPFNPSTTITFDLAKTEHVRLEIYGVNGALISTLVNEIREAGSHSVRWDGRDMRGSSVSSGIYFYRLITSSGIETKKMIMLR